MSSALSETIKEHGPALYRIAWRILHHAEEADDVLQDVALQAIQISKSGKQIDSWIGLLKRITVCRSLDQLRKRRPVVAFSEDDFAGRSAKAIDTVIERELEERLRIALLSLPNRQAEVFSLRYFDDCSNQEIALSLDISTAAVATALKKSRQRLRICRKGDRFRRSYVNPFERITRIKKGPGKDVDLREWWNEEVKLAYDGPNGTPYNVVIGKEIWDFDSNSKTFQKERHPDSGFHCWSLRPDMIARPPMGGSAAHLEIRIDENPKTGPDGTILYELVHAKQNSVTRLWIDPNQGHLVVQFEMGTDKQWESQTIVEKAAQSPKGIWYPVRLRNYWRHEGKVNEDETNCYVDFETELPDELFKVK